MTVLQVFVLLFIFVKRQIVRFAMKSRRGPHVPLGHNAPKVCLFHTRAHTVKTLAPLHNNTPEASCQTILLICYSRVVSVLCAAGTQTRNWSQIEPCPENPLWASSAVPRRWPTEAQRAFWLERRRRTHTCCTMLLQIKRLMSVCAYVCVSVCAGSYDYLYRMRALDAIRDTGELLLLLILNCVSLLTRWLLHGLWNLCRFTLPWTGWHVCCCNR